MEPLFKEAYEQVGEKIRNLEGARTDESELRRKDENTAITSLKTDIEREELIMTYKILNRITDFDKDRFSKVVWRGRG